MKKFKIKFQRKTYRQGLILLNNILKFKNLKIIIKNDGGFTQ